MCDYELLTMVILMYASLMHSKWWAKSSFSPCEETRLRQMTMTKYHLLMIIINFHGVSWYFEWFLQKEALWPRYVEFCRLRILGIHHAINSTAKYLRYVCYLMYSTHCSVEHETLTGKILMKVYGSWTWPL